MAKIDDYQGQRFTVENVDGRCIHSRYCVLNLPSVFVPNAEGPWIKPDAASAEATIAVITKCPSGALRYKPVGDTAAEQAPGVNSVRVWEDGPLAIYAELNVDGDGSGLRGTLCRCGQSFHKPYCDGMHKKAGFKATGEPPSQTSEPLQTRNGPLKVTSLLDGPLHIEGALEICAASGQTVARTTETWLCRCGHSNDKPFCDGSHKAAEFRAAGQSG